MIKLRIIAYASLAVLILISCTKRPQRILIFSKTKEFRHINIEEGVEAIKKIAEAQGIMVETTENADYFNEDSLKRYSAVIFLNTTGDVLNNSQQADFERYIQAGGGFVGIHAATDTEYHWPWYNQLVGAYFDGHPDIQDATLRIIEKEDPICQHLSDNWEINEEWYNFRSLNPDINVLMEVDESSYEGGKNGPNHPIVWKHFFDGGRSFYTALGHKAETFYNSDFLKQVLAGIEFAIGENSLDYSMASTQRLPEENRFTKQVLDFNLDEPMELDELEGRGILYIERRGLIKLFDYETEQVKILDSLDTYYGDEDGLLGLAVDPNYSENAWIYLFYSTMKEKNLQYISRFTLLDDKLSDEQILLKIPVERHCCHSGGALEFDKDGLLYIGVGDNTNPFESSGYAPIDERTNRKLFDAQRSAANTNDLRGKILRIKPETDGTYSIPEGNLFPVGKADCRAEIYIMGCRNPFRFSIDPRTNFLYWGDVGPDAGESDSLRGPTGMGEWNQAREAGFYGWPYSRGNNQMYKDYDFGHKKSGLSFDPLNIINDSPNNTGLKDLPPIQESMIWYGYDQSNQFPWLGEGGVNPMSGPIYHAGNNPVSANSFPAYFEGKWFVYEWMRDWIYVVHLDQNGQFVQADPFMSGTEFSHPMDMKFSKNGNLYLLEYGQNWNTKNLDARLSVIRYNPGNRPPVAVLETDKEVGAVPLTVRFSAITSIDHDNDELKYDWLLDGNALELNSAFTEHVFQEPGMYDIELVVTDSKGESTRTNKKIMAGNAPPKMEIKLRDTSSIYWKNKTLHYSIEVSDLEDGNTINSTLDTSNVKVTFNYVPEGEDIILASIGHQQNAIPKGLSLINASDCKACHSISEKTAGPSYQDIAKKYEIEDKHEIVHRIIKGSQGIWGEYMMAPHPQLEVEDVEEMVYYILSLDPDKQFNESNLPIEGTIKFDQHLQDRVAGKYVLMASYLDQGNPAVEGSSLSVFEEIVFYPPKFELEDAIDLDKDLGIWENLDRTIVGSIKDGKNIKTPPVDFNNLSSITIGAVFSKEYFYSGKVEIRQGGLNGTLLGEELIESYDEFNDSFKTFKINLKPSQGTGSIYLVFKNPKDTEQYIMNGDWVQLNYH